MVGMRYLPLLLSGLMRKKEPAYSPLHDSTIVRDTRFSCASRAVKLKDHREQIQRVISARILRHGSMSFGLGEAPAGIMEALTVISM